MSHRNAPLTIEGRHRLVLRCQHRPIAHVAAEAGVSRQCLSKWVNRYREHGQAGLADRSSAPHHRPTQTSQVVVERIIELRKKHRSATRIATDLAAEGVRIAACTVTRILHRVGLPRLSWLDADGEPLRAPGTITARYPGHMIHIDVKKAARIPDGGGWRVHGRGSAQDKAADRAARAGGRKGTRAGYTYIHSAVDGFSRLAYSECHDDETATTVVAFLSRARVFFRAHGITRYTRIVTDNGPAYTSKHFTRHLASFASRHQRIRPYTPKHNGKVERYQGLMSSEVLYARAWTSEQQRRNGISIWVNHYNYHRPHTAAGGKPPASRLKTRVNNVLPSYN